MTSTIELMLEMIHFWLNENKYESSNSDYFSWPNLQLKINKLVGVNKKCCATTWPTIATIGQEVDSGFCQMLCRILYIMLEQRTICLDI